MMEKLSDAVLADLCIKGADDCGAALMRTIALIPDPRDQVSFFTSVIYSLCVQRSLVKIKLHKTSTYEEELAYLNKSIALFLKLGLEKDHPGKYTCVHLEDTHG